MCVFEIAGLTIFRGISAHDADKPTSPNSEISYTILAGNEARKWKLESKHSNKAVINLNRALDFDGGDRFFNLTIRAQVGSRKEENQRSAVCQCLATG